jgi:6-pyruvoyltetrahydropterin/6-carboxytetrahydropterin synthase
LDENHYVIDFILLRDTMRAIVSELDHYVLLPTDHPLIKVAATDREVTATFDERRWVFPRQDCVLLPIPNTTSEMLARHIGRRLLAELEEATGARPSLIRIEVDECFGQIAVCDLRDE